MRKIILPIVGEKKNKLTIISLLDACKSKDYILCKCDCSKEHKIRLDVFLYMNQNGCKHCAVSKHNLTNTRFYRIWKGIKTRCEVKSQTSFKRYGAKGITYCKEWSEFKNFFNDMYQDFLSHCNKYSESKTCIDRIDNTLGYSKENCRWVTPKENSSNRLNSKNFIYKGKETNLSDIARNEKIKHPTLYNRIFNMGLSLEDAIIYNVKQEYNKQIVALNN